jgi:hypothetical protein
MIRLFLLISCCLAIACTPSDASRKNDIEGIASEEVARDTSSALKVNSLHQDFALWIAGLSLKDTSSGYSTYRQSSDAIWKKVETRKIFPILTFRDSFLSPVYQVKKLFYPFSGGDFLYANVFFPQADTILMVGLEPPGTLFPIDSLSETGRQTYLSRLSQSLFFSNELGFFRTLSMEKELKQERLNGTLHPILFYLARSGYQVNRIEPGTVTPDGQWTSCGDSSCLTLNTLYYTRPGEPREKVLYYFSMDLSNSGLNRNPGFTKFMSNQGELGCFLKAASYLLHQSDFSSIRDLILTQSSWILQDDSGVPLKHLKSHYSDIQVFGEYTQTIPLFASFYQPELKTLFSDSARVKKTGFIIGYNQKFQQTNLIFAKKTRTL